MQPFHELLAELVCGKLGQLANFGVCSCTARATRAIREQLRSNLAVSSASYSTLEQRGAPESFSSSPEPLQLFAVLAVARTGRGAPAAGLHRCTKYAP